jgi:UDP-N-acetylmuramyl pentapeptide phosphotransferase/UDP-N-acetylglucosamine-1-phosphate transferase
VNYIRAHWKWIAGALFAAASTYLTAEYGPGNIWVAVVIPTVAVALGVQFSPSNKKTPRARRAPAHHHHAAP